MRFADSDIAMCYTNLGIGHGHEKRSSPPGSLQWGTSWSDWEEQEDDVQEATGLTLCVDDIHNESDSSDDSDEQIGDLE